MSPIPYVPDSYVCHPHRIATVHASDEEPEPYVALVVDCLCRAAEAVENILGFSGRRRLHVCIYRNSDDARRALRREVPTSFAMAPYCSGDLGVVVLHSVAAEPANAGPHRLLRLLVHEIAHQAVAESTDSSKVLGDGNRGMRISTWLNEGVAELASLEAIGSSDRIEAALRQFRSAREFFTFRLLSDCLDSLDHRERCAAFDHATAAVALLSRSAGLRGLFRDLLETDARFRPDERCTPQRIEAG